MEQNSIHTFDNGVRVYERQLLDVQRARYNHRNVHEEEEEDVFLGALARVPSGGIFLNIGAAVGYYVILAKLKRPDFMVHAVEALPSQAARLRENLSLNGLCPSDIQLHEVAIGATNNPTARLMDADYSSLLLGDAEKTEHRVVSVKSITLSEFCGSIGPRIDLLQMDIQGLELPVFKRFFADPRPTAITSLLIGTHGDKIHSELISLFQRNGYGIDFESAHPKHQPDGIILARTAANS